MRLRAPPEGEADRFPFSVPAVRTLETLDLDVPLVFFAGENGSGKSTLLEAMALAANLPSGGSSPLASDETLAAQRRLADRLSLVWNRRTHRGFFFRAEDFFGFLLRQGELRRQMEARLAEVERDMADASEYARGLAAGPARASLGEMGRLYGEDADARSHGEGTLGFMGARIRPGGLHLVDEPEAALSPQSQLALLALLRERIDEGAQFVVATHSPILLAAPGARILSFDDSPPAPVAWDELEGVRLYRAFLEAPERYLRHLWP